MRSFTHLVVLCFIFVFCNGFVAIGANCGTPTLGAWHGDNGPEVRYRVDEASIRLMQSDVNPSPSSADARMDAVVSGAKAWRVSSDGFHYAYDGSASLLDLTQEFHSNYGLSSTMGATLLANAMLNLCAFDGKFFRFNPVVYAAPYNEDPLMPKPSYTAFTVPYYCGPDIRGFIVEINNNAVQQWNSSSDPNVILRAPGASDFQTVVTHELGHALGLQHDRAGGKGESVGTVIPQTIFDIYHVISFAFGPFIPSPLGQFIRSPVFLFNGGPGDPPCGYDAYGRLDPTQEHATMCKTTPPGQTMLRRIQDDDRQGLMTLYPGPSDYGVTLNDEGDDWHFAPPMTPNNVDSPESLDITFTWAFRPALFEGKLHPLGTTHFLFPHYTPENHCYYVLGAFFQTHFFSSDEGKFSVEVFCTKPDGSVYKAFEHLDSLDDHFDNGAGGVLGVQIMARGYTGSSFPRREDFHAVASE